MPKVLTKAGLAVVLSAVVAGIMIPQKAQAEDVFEMAFKSDKQMVTLGEEVKVSLDFLVHDSFSIEPVTDNGQFAPFEVKRIDFSRTESVRGVRSESYQVVLTIFEMGEFKIDSFPVYFSKNGGPKRVVYSEPIEIRTVSVVGSAAELKDIKPIKGQESLKSGMIPWWIWPILIIVIFTGLLFFTKVGQVIITNWKERMLTPEQRAFRQLERLAETRPSGKAEFYQFYSQLSQAMRQIIIHGCRVGSMDLTTREWKMLLESEASTKEYADLISGILNDCDMVRFAARDAGADAAVQAAGFALELSRKITAEKEVKQEQKQS